VCSSWRRRAGAQSASLTLSTVAGGNPYPLTATATALPVQGLLLTPFTQDFGTVRSEQHLRAAQTFTLANVLSSCGAGDGAERKRERRLHYLSANTYWRSLRAQECWRLRQVASCRLPLRPTTSRRAQRYIDGRYLRAGTLTAALSGYGAEDPGLAIRFQSRWTFHEVPGSIATTQTITFTNTGASTLSLGTPLVSDPSFTVASNCSALAPSSTCSLTVSFTPQPATVAATLSVPVTQTVNGQTSTASYSIALSGAYTSENAGLELLPGQVNFGSNATGALGANAGVHAEQPDRRRP
jgi:hypothetical protein